MATLENGTTQFDSQDSSIVEILWRGSLAGLASAIGWILDPKRLALSSLWQFLGYFLALLCFCTAEDLNDAGWRIVPPDSRQTGTLSFPTNVTGLAILATVSWLVTCLAAFSLERPAADYSTLSLNPSPTPYADIDIVIARYDEAASSVADNINALLVTPKIQAKDVRFIIYNKGTQQEDFQHDVAAMISDQSEVQFQTLDNVGREGDTYLHHIVNNWNNFSTHTLFMQAEPHDLDLATNYHQTLFIPETGFLSLSYESDVCETCDQCLKPGWAEDPALLSKLYETSNAGKKCQNLVLTYRGQFIVSAARVRGNERAVYEDLLQQLRISESYFHSEEYTESRRHRDQEDSVDHAVFGFTLERMWGVLMQCSDPRVGYWAPSPLAVWVRPGWVAGGFLVEDAQCLDRTTGTTTT